MFIFGWGNKTKSWSVGNGKELLAKWKYFHILWFPIAGKITWYVIGDNRSEDKIIPYETVKMLIPKGTPHISPWNRFGLFWLILTLITISIFSQA